MLVQQVGVSRHPVGDRRQRSLTECSKVSRNEGMRRKAGLAIFHNFSGLLRRKFFEDSFHRCRCCLVLELVQNGGGSVIYDDYEIYIWCI